MKYPPYNTYKDSGVEWLGAVPEHWEVKRLKYAANRIMGQSPSSEDYSHDSSERPFLQGNAEFTDRFPIPRVYCDTSNKTVPIGSLLLSVRAPVGAINFADKKYGIGRGLCAVVPITKELNAGFAWYLFTVSRTELLTKATGSTYEAVSADEVGNMLLSIPPFIEQKTIANFLDAQTAKIDKLISKKREFIDKLKEKRMALISRTVTRGLPPDAAKAAGLNPNPKLKPSGIEWLGDVPEHWEIKRIKHIGKIRYGLGEPPEYVDNGLPFIRATDIKSGKIDLDSVRRISPKDVPWSRRPKLAQDEILVVRSGAYTGDSALISTETAGCIAGYDMVLSINAAQPRFVAWVLLSRYMLEGQIYLERLRAAQPHLNAEELGNFVIFVPPISEQNAIAHHLHRETSKIDRMIEKVEAAIEKLQEYRTALITAAVTGKIDVRESAKQ